MATAIAKSEFEERWKRTQDACREAGVDGLVAVSRCAAIADSYADVMYLANHYNAFVLCQDVPRWWVGRSHAAVIIPLDGEPTLVVDVPDWRRDLVVIDDVRLDLNVPKAAAEVLKERGLHEGRLGFAGGHAMLASPYRTLVAELPGAELVPFDDTMESIRVRKSPRELELLREANEIGSKVAQAIMETAVKPGVTEADAVAAGVDVATKNLINVYDVAVASGPNSMKYSHGRLPSWTDRTLEEGDFFHIDTYGAHEGYLYDFSRTVLVGGKPNKEQEEILEAAIAAIDAGVEAIRPGMKGKDVYAAVRKVLDDRGMTGDGFMGELDNTPALTSAFPGHGHSIGLFWEAPWLFEDEELEVPANSCYGIECAAGREGVGSAMFEQDVIVTDERTELITKTDKRFW